jgi:hypothetical protein
MSRPTRLRRACFLAIGLIVGFTLIEGLGRLLIAGFPGLAPQRQALREPPQREGGHTRHDPELGWSSRPGLRLRDAYGPGVHIQINAQGFRSAREFSPEAPEGRLRAVCSGDSFTFGHGVGNGQTWCQQLEALEPRLQTVNMGQGAYGLDQAYLWYLRDGVKLQHGLHLYAFITDDIPRMQRAAFDGHGKPVLRVSGGRLQVGNVPVPEPSGPSLARSREALGRLASVRLLAALLSGVLPGGSLAPDAPVLDAAQTRAVLSGMLEHLRELHRANGSVLVLVHLPVKREAAADGLWGEWKPFLAAEASRLGIPCFDLAEDFRALPPQALDALFLLPHGGHYSVRGHRTVARVLRRKLGALPEVQSRLRALDGVRRGGQDSRRGSS